MDSSSDIQHKEKQLVVVLVGAPGSGKSTFCELVIRRSSRPWVRICQDVVNNGKAGTRSQCIKKAEVALLEGKNVFIDRCNLDKEQRSEFVKLGGHHVDVHAVVLDLPAEICRSRSVKRVGHEGNLQGGKAAAVVNKMLRIKELPEPHEGFSRISICKSDTDIQTVVGTYSGSSSDSIASGLFLPKESDSKTQQGITKYFKKAESQPISQNHESGDKTLAFPSLSTSDFQFDIEKASEIIVDKVEEYANKLGNARLVLVDISFRSIILSLVREKATQRGVNLTKFSTLVGDITRLFSTSGFHCEILANSANWRLKPGGGGVNAAIFESAGPSFEAATKERASHLLPGQAVAVPVPADSPLHTREGVSHVIHVLGPNMNPQRPNCLHNDYTTGCKVLRDAYTSLFETFLSIVRSRRALSSSNKDFVPSSLEFKAHKREGSGVGNSRSYANVSHRGANTDAINVSASKEWSSWAQALHHIAMYPERHEAQTVEVTDDVVVLNDLYPKARRHVLVLARVEGLDSLADVHKKHLPLLMTMHSMGLKWARQFIDKDSSLIFRMGYHSGPSMRQLHLHVISQDFMSDHLKKKIHWNSFNTPFFRDSTDVIEEVQRHGKAVLKPEGFLSAELRCHRCQSAHPNIPKLKLHISKCQHPFPASLLQNNRLIMSSSY